MIEMDVPFLDLALSTPGQVVENVAEFAADVPKQSLSSVLGNEDHVVFTIPLAVTKPLVVHGTNSLSWALSGSPRELLPTVPGNVKLRRPPRQSRGDSRLR
jgi:hypothetical protein